MGLLSKIKNVLTGSEDAKRAAAAQQTGIANSNELIREFLAKSEGAFGDVENLLANPGQITDDPTFQFRLDEALKGTARSLNARGLGASGREKIALTDRGNIFAGNVFNDKFNQLFGVAQSKANIFSGAGAQLSGNAIDSGTIEANRLNQKRAFKQGLLKSGLQVGAFALGGGFKNPFAKNLLSKNAPGVV